MRVLITGATGQLGTELGRSQPAGIETISLSRKQCDIRDASAVQATLSGLRPDIVINTAAYTSVDRAEEDRNEAFAVNATGAGNVARAAMRIDARVIHISTDYVFDGDRTAPYPPDAETNPLSVYGASKLAGETEVRSAGGDALVIRTGWLYSAIGKNFLSTILAALQESREVRVVDDQVGVPTCTRDLACAIWSCVDRPRLVGIQHWVNQGSATWYEFAVAIREAVLDRAMIEAAAPVVPISTSEYRSRAKRPPYSVLDASDFWTTLGATPKYWREALTTTIEEFVGERPLDHSPRLTQRES